MNYVFRIRLFMVKYKNIERSEMKYRTRLITWSFLLNKNYKKE